MIALGSAQLGMPYGIGSSGRPSPAAAVDILETASALGVRYIDTAAAYGDAERIIGRFLIARPDLHVQVGTKLRTLPAGLTGSALADAVSSEIEASRARLQVQAIDDVLIHAVQNLREYGARLVAAMNTCIDRGLVRRIGISLYDPEDVPLVLAHRALDVIQFPFSALDQRFLTSGASATLREHGKTIFARSVLLQGLLVLPSSSAEAAVPGACHWVETFQRICDDWRAAPLAGAIGFAEATGVADHLVVGVDSVAQLHGVMAAYGARAPAGLVAALRETLCDVPAAVRDPRAWARTA